MTNVALGGIVELGQYDLNLNENLFAVAADPLAPASSDYLYVVGQNTVHAVERGNLGAPGYSAQSVAGFGNGPIGDPQFLLDPVGGSDRREFWTLASPNARYIFRVTDFTQSGMHPPDAPDVSEGHYSAGPADGGVANFFWNSVYMPTFGGVVRWDISGTVPIPNPNPGLSYRPAQDPLTGQDYITEHLELVNLGSAASPDWRLLAPTAQGSYFEWPLDTLTHDPLSGSLQEPLSGYWPGWEPPPTGTNVYGNDVAVWYPAAGAPQVLIDYSELGGTDLRLGRHVWGTGTWPTSLDWTDPSPGVPPDITGYARDLAVEGDWALLAAEGGFVVFDLLTGQATDHVYTSDVAGRSFAHVMGIEKSGDRIFASLGDSTNRFAFAMYAFDAATGHVIDPVTGLQSDDAMQVLFDGITHKPDDFPGVFLNEGERMSLVVTQNDPKTVRLYSGSGNGNLVEIEWSAITDTMTPLSTWNNGGYFSHVADCNVYKMGLPTGGFGPSMGPGVPAFTLRILVAKTSETFEIVSPPDMP